MRYTRSLHCNACIITGVRGIRSRHTTMCRGSQEVTLTRVDTRKGGHVMYTTTE